MKNSTTLTPWKRSALCLAISFPLATLPMWGQDIADVNEEEVYELSPFKVDASDDSGYRATNTISGSRLNTKLKDIPMPIEVITEEFIDDTGSTDLREALKYSAGILTTSQNDAGKGNSTVGTGGVHNPEGTTANKTSTSYKVRGFITEATLRDGYRRQVASDSVNIGRVEVVRGPSALLYGIGNFGGIVNYIPKMPSSVQEQFGSFSVGNNGHMRGTYEVSKPVGTEWDVKFLLTAAYEQNDAYSELSENKHHFLSPVITFSPTDKTDVVIDFESGDYEADAIGYQSVRVNSNLDLSAAASQQDRLENSGFLVFPGEVDHRTMRMSGSDPYLNTNFDNLRLQVTHSFMDNLNVLVGYNEANVEYDVYDFGASVAPAIVGNTTHDRFAGSAYVLTSNGDVALAVDSNGDPIPMLGQGTENNTLEDINRQQLRTEINYNFDMFEKSERLQMTHSFLVGQSKEIFRKNVSKKDFADGEFNFFNPSIYSYRESGLNGDGTAGFTTTDASFENSSSSNTGTYFVYQGKFLNDRITAIVGRRNDKNDVTSTFRDLRTGSDPSTTISPEQSNYTSQIGLSFEIIPQLTIFALEAEGLSPNFDGKRDLQGDAIKASTATSREIGLKFELLEGKLSGSISSYTIEQVGKPTSFWWAPANGKSTFNRDQDIVYNVGNFNPMNNGGNGAAVASQAEWDAAVAAGAAFQATPEGASQAGWYLNASTPEGAAYMDSVFYKTRGVERVGGELVSVDGANPYAGWPGWLYDRDSIVNAAFEDWAAPDNEWDAWSPSNEESTGFEINLQYQPNDRWQMVFSGSKTERKVTKVFDMPQYEWGSAGIDRWATWFFPDGSWGLTGAFGPNEAYSDEANGDTSSWQAIGLLQGQPQDDTPKYEVSYWNTYSFSDGKLAGLQLGLGAWWQDKREFESGITDGAGQIAVDPETGRPYNKTHKDRHEINLMAKYNFQAADRDAFVQLNVNNVMDDKDRYGWLYAPGVSWRLTYGMDF